MYSPTGKLHAIQTQSERNPEEASRLVVNEVWLIASTQRQKPSDMVLSRTISSVTKF